MGQRGFAADSDASARTDEASQKKDIKQDTGMEENSEEAAERGTETEQDTEEFPPLNSDGVGCIILAPEEEDTFADKCGFGGCEPFYSYSHPEYEFSLVLYLDEESGRGCGIRKWQDGNGDDILSAFRFSDCGEIPWEEPDPYALESAWGDDLSDASEYETEYEYDSAGRITQIRVMGISGWYDEEESVIEEALSLNFTYDENGTLRKREYVHNTHFFATTFQSMKTWYDENGRPIYTYSYITHGSLEDFYIYKEDQETPAYVLRLDNQYYAWPDLFRYTQP